MYGEDNLVSLNDIVALPEMQIRGRTDPKLVKKYANAMQRGEIFPPITVACIEGREGFILVDGFHRLEAMKSLFPRKDYPEIEVVECKSLEEVKWRAANANLRHGQPLKTSRMREVFKAYIKAGQHRLGKTRYKSYRQIATDLGGLVAYSTVRNWMKADFPRIARSMGGDEDLPKGKGGLSDNEPLGAALYRQASEHLDQVLAIIPSLTDANSRTYLWERAHKIADELERMNEGRMDSPF